VKNSVQEQKLLSTPGGARWSSNEKKITAGENVLFFFFFLLWTALPVVR